MPSPTLPSLILPWEEVRRTVEEETRDTPQGKITLRRTTIEEVVRATKDEGDGVARIEHETGLSPRIGGVSIANG